MSLKSDTDLIPLLFKVADQGEAAEAGTSNSKRMNTLIDTGSLGPDGNYIHTDLVKAFANKQSIITYTSTDSVCSGLDSTCSTNMEYMFLSVNINSEQVKLKLFILASTPFDAIIGLEAIRKHNLLAKFPAYFGLASPDIDINTENTLPFLVPAYCQPCRKSLCKITVDKPPPCIAQSDSVFDYIESVIGDHTIVADGAVPPKQFMRHNKHKKLHDNAKLSKELNLKSSHALVQCSLLSTNMVQSFFEGHDGAPAERNPNMSSRTCAVYAMSCSIFNNSSWLIIVIHVTIFQKIRRE